jgi:hypothetical protein
MEGRKIKRLSADLVPIEGLQMSQVKDEPMTFWDGPGVEGFRLDYFE